MSGCVARSTRNGTPNEDRLAFRGNRLQRENRPKSDRVKRSSSPATDRLSSRKISRLWARFPLCVNEAGLLNGFARSAGNFAFASARFILSPTFCVYFEWVYPSNGWMFDPFLRRLCVSKGDVEILWNQRLWKKILYIGVCIWVSGEELLNKF